MLLTGLVAALRGEVGLLLLAALLAVPAVGRLSSFVRVTRLGRWYWPAVRSGWTPGYAVWLVLACVVGLLLAVLRAPGWVTTLATGVAGAWLLVAPPAPEPPFDRRAVPPRREAGAR